MTIDELLRDLNALRDRYADDDTERYVTTVDDLILATDPDAEASIAGDIGDRDDEWVLRRSDEVEGCDVDTDPNRWRITLNGRRYIAENPAEYIEDRWTAQSD